MRAKRTDKNHRAIGDAMRAMGWAVKSLHTQGGGVEDFLVGISTASGKRWVLVEAKSPRYKLTASTAVRFTPAQREWYAQTEGFPRLVVTSAQDAVDKLRRMVG